MSGLAIIGGTGLETLPAEYALERFSVQTRFGPAAVARASRAGAEPVIFLSRHGEQHGIAPHAINYRANIAALVELGVTRALATNAVGSLRLDLQPGSLVLLDDFIDFTRGRPTSFWADTGEADSVVHTDFTEPYCPELRGILQAVASERDLALLPRGTYLCAEGPRFETPAEISLFASWGADVVGMTGLPEAVFAREAGICYAAIAIVTNFGAGLTPTPVAHEQVLVRMAESAAAVRELLIAAAARIPAHRTCACGTVAG